MKNKSLLNWTIAFFIIVNTSHFWEGKIGVFGMFSILILIGIFFILGIALVYQIVKSIQEKFVDKKRLILIGIMTLVLSTTLLKPNGLINFDRLEGKDILVAQREGGGNCLTRLKLKENQKFIKKSYCFGVSETRGKYEMKGDTVYFKDKKGNQIEDFYEFGIIQKKDTTFTNNASTILLFDSDKEEKSNFLLITKNEFK